MSEKITRRNKVEYMVKIAILSAIATVLMIFEIPLWFAPSFYEIDLSEVAVLIGGFAMGPMAAIIIEALKILLNLCINFTTTAGVGEFANFILGCAFVVPASIIYKKRKTIGGAILSASVGAIVLGAVGVVMNLFVLLPAYSFFYGMPMEAIVAAGAAVNASITDLTTLVLFAVLPFNLLKGLLSGIITVLMYKGISFILRR